MREMATNTYSLKLPKHWEAAYNEKDGFVSIYDPNGRGAITVSSYTFPSETAPNIAYQLRKFIRNEDISIKTEKKGDQEVGTIEYKEPEPQGHFTYATAVKKNNNLILASYHCKNNHFSIKELKQVKKIFASIELNQ